MILILLYLCAECITNQKANGTCQEGALEPDCCECDTIGNATHAFYKTRCGDCLREFFNKVEPVTTAIDLFDD